MERHQVWIYLAAILAGLFLGMTLPGLAGPLGLLVWPVLAALLFVTFVQIPLVRLPEALVDLRFMAAVLAGNFVIVPLIVLALLPLLPDDPAVRLGVLLVLLVPCTDWFITFTQLGRGDAGRAVAVTPLNLLAQLVLLPAYLWLFMGEAIAGALHGGGLAAAFLGLILGPLLLAFLCQGCGRQKQIDGLAWLPVPLLAIVVFMVAASQVTVVLDALPVLAKVLPVFVLFLIAAPLAALALAGILRLPTNSARALAFSLGTRNSFMVLPVALALPSSWESAVVVVVFQSLVELFGMTAYLWAIPRVFFPGRP